MKKNLIANGANTFRELCFAFDNKEELRCCSFLILNIETTFISAMRDKEILIGF